MRPLPVSGVRRRESGTFFCAVPEFSKHIVSFKCLTNEKGKFDCHRPKIRTHGRSIEADQLDAGPKTIK